MISQKDKDGIWQFMLDHAKVQIKKDGSPVWYISFPAKNDTDFWQRVNYRVQGVYKTVEKEEIEEKYTSVYKRIDSLVKEVQTLKGINATLKANNWNKVMYWAKKYFMAKYQKTK